MFQRAGKRVPPRRAPEGRESGTGVMSGVYVEDTPIKKGSSRFSLHGAILPAPRTANPSRARTGPVRPSRGPRFRTGCRVGPRNANRPLLSDPQKEQASRRNAEPRRENNRRKTSSGGAGLPSFLSAPPRLCVSRLFPIDEERKKARRGRFPAGPVFYRRRVSAGRAPPPPARPPGRTRPPAPRPPWRPPRPGRGPPPRCAAR
jgi:hypothetical protein